MTDIAAGAEKPKTKIKQIDWKQYLTYPNVILGLGWFICIAIGMVPGDGEPAFHRPAGPCSLAHPPGRVLYLFDVFHLFCRSVQLGLRVSGLSNLLLSGAHQIHRRDSKGKVPSALPARFFGLFPLLHFRGRLGGGDPAGPAPLCRYFYHLRHPHKAEGRPAYVPQMVFLFGCGGGGSGHLLVARRQHHFL